MSEKTHIKTILVKIKDLKENKHNPRQITKSQHEQLKRSIQNFGFLDPLIVNIHSKRKNIIVGGHQRFRIAQELGYTELPVVYVSLTLPREKELNLRLNKNTGEWDKDILANNYDIADLIDIGFKQIELGLYIDKIDLKIDTEIKPSKLLERESNCNCSCRYCQSCINKDL